MPKSCHSCILGRMVSRKEEQGSAYTNTYYPKSLTPCRLRNTTIKEFHVRRSKEKTADWDPSPCTPGCIHFSDSSILLLATKLSLLQCGRFSIGLLRMMHHGGRSLVTNVVFTLFLRNKARNSYFLKIYSKV